MSQGEAAVQIYVASCNEGSAVTVFLRIDVVGRDGAGKTSLTKSLTLQTFNPDELSTRGVVFDPKCQIIVKESCDWTTPLTRKAYRDIYDKNITAIMAESLNKPELRGEYLSSKVEQRPMQLKLDADSIRSVKFMTEEEPTPLSLVEDLPSLDLAIPRMDPVVSVAEDVISNSECMKDKIRRETKENVLQPSLSSSPQVSIVGCTTQVMQKESANPVSDTSTKKKDNTITKHTASLSKLRGRPKNHKQTRSKKHVPDASPRTTSDKLGKQTIVHSKKVMLTSPSMPSVEASAGPAYCQSVSNKPVEDAQAPMTTQQAVGSHSEDATSVPSTQELPEQKSGLPQVTSQTDSLCVHAESRIKLSTILPSIPESTKQKVVEMLRSREICDKVKNEMIVTVLDYAGQNVFYATHQLCMSKEGFYYVVFNALLQLDAVTPSVFRLKKGEIVHIPLQNDETNYDRVEEWVSSIHIIEPSNSHRIILFEKVGIRSPAVFLVGTHADELKDQPGMLERQDAFLRNKLEGTVLSEHIVWASKNRMCFYVDNTVTNPQSGTVDEQVVLLRQKTEEVARQVAQHHRLPITWLKFEEEVREVKETDKTKKTASVEEMMQIAMKAAGIKSKEELFVLLYYLSNRSVLLYHPLALKCEDAKEVVLDVEWLISQLEKVITVQTDVPAMFKNAVIRSSEKGIMTVELMKHLLKDSGSARYLIMSLMNQFDLLCEYAALEDLKQADDERDYVNLSSTKHEPSAQDINDYQACFIPCLLQRPTTLQSTMVPDSFKTPFLLLSSGCLRMPRPLFYRLLTRLCKRFQRLPQLFQNAAYFLVYHNHKLEIVLNRYSLQMSILTTNETTPLPAVCFLVRDFVVNAVNEAKQVAMAGLELELGFTHKLRNGCSSDTLVEFVSLEGYPTKRKNVRVRSMDMDISLPTEMRVWFPSIVEVLAKKHNLCTKIYISFL